MKRTLGALLILLAATGAVAQAPKTKAKAPDYSHGYWMAVNDWDDEVIAQRTDFAFNYFVRREQDRAGFATFRLCMAHIPSARRGTEPDPTPEHLRACDRVIDRLEKYLKVTTKW